MVEWRPEIQEDLQMLDTQIQLPIGNMRRWEVNKLLPDSPWRDSTAKFFEYLTTKFHGNTTLPRVFWSTVDLAFEDLKRGTDTNGKRIEIDPHVAASEPLVRREIPNVIAAIFPAEDADLLTLVRLMDKPQEVNLSTADREAIGKAAAAIPEKHKKGWGSAKKPPRARAKLSRSKPKM